MSYMFDDPDRCEECGSRDILEEAVVAGRGLRLCPKCIHLSGALVIRKIDNPNVEIRNFTVRERLAKMAGVSLKNRPEPSREYQSPVSLDDLRKRYEEVKKRRALEAEKARAAEYHPESQKPRVLDTDEFLNKLEKESPESAETLLQGVENEKGPKKNMFKEFFGKFKIKRAKKEASEDITSQEVQQAPDVNAPNSK
jgi:hypothetical protein